MLEYLESLIEIILEHETKYLKYIKYLPEKRKELLNLTDDQFFNLVENEFLKLREEEQEITDKLLNFIKNDNEAQFFKIIKEIQARNKENFTSLLSSKVIHKIKNDISHDIRHSKITLIDIENFLKKYSITISEVEELLKVNLFFYLFKGSNDTETINNELALFLLKHTNFHIDSLERSSFNNTVLMWVCANGNYSQALQLLELGANPFILDSENKHTLHLLIMKGHERQLPIFEKILQHTQIKDHINDQDKFGRTALHIACARKNKKYIEGLLKLGANTDIKDNEGRTAQDIFQLNSLKRMNYIFQTKHETIEECVSIESEIATFDFNSEIDYETFQSLISSSILLKHSATQPSESVIIQQELPENMSYPTTHSNLAKNQVLKENKKNHLLLRNITIGISFSITLVLILALSLYLYQNSKLSVHSITPFSNLKQI